MDSEPLISVTQRQEIPRAITMGRPVDLFAAVLAGIACLAGIIMTVIFFWGFAENDTHLLGLLSAFVFSFILGSFAIVPAFYIACLAYKGWKKGLPRNAAWKALFLTLPWVILSIIFIGYAPIPLFVSWVILGISSILCLWSAASLLLKSSQNIDE